MDFADRILDRNGCAAATGARTMVGALVVLLASCRSTAGTTLEYTVDVYGSKLTMDSFALEAEGMETDGVLRFARNQYVRRFRYVADYRRANTFATLLRVPQTNSFLEIAPFVCRGNASLQERAQDGGWSFRELNEFSIDPGGTLRANTDLSRKLSYTCEVSKGADGEGVGQLEYSERLCGDPGRETSVKIEFAGGQGTPRECSAQYVLKPEGISAHFGFQMGDMIVGVGLEDCIDSGTSFPHVVKAGAPTPNCSRRPRLWANLLPSGGFFLVEASEGEFVFENADIVDQGRLGGVVDLTFPLDAAPPEVAALGKSARIHGTFDFPMIRVLGAGGAGSW